MDSRLRPSDGCGGWLPARVAASAQERGYLSIDEQGSRHAFSFRGEADRGERVARTIFREGLGLPRAARPSRGAWPAPVTVTSDPEVF